MIDRVSPTEKADILKIRFDLTAYRVVMDTIKGWKRKGERRYVAISNPHCVMLCHRDTEMRKATQSAGMVVPDGVGIILAAQLLGYRHNGRVTGPELMLKLCDWGRKEKYRHFFYGGGEGVAEALSHHLTERYPGLKVAGTSSPPFRPLSEQEDRAIVEQINGTKPDVVWVGLGAPKQEKWMAEHLGRINATVMIGVGAAFDFHSGNVGWAPAWMRKCGLEWAYRLAQEPKRMWRKNLDNPIFLAKVLRQRLEMTLQKTGFEKTGKIQYRPEMNPGNNKKSFCVITNGCIECRMEASEVERSLVETPSLWLCKDYTKADLIIFLGCSVNQEKEELSSKIIEVIEDGKKPGAQLLPLGCILKSRPDLACHDKKYSELVKQIKSISRFEDHDFPVASCPYPEFWQISDSLFDRRTSSEMLCGYCHRNPEGILGRASVILEASIIKAFAKYRRRIDKEIQVPSDKTFCLRVSTGCMGNCSYCSIKLARGRIKSRPIDDIVKSFRQGLEMGYKDFALLGTDVGDYGKDRGKDLLDLLKKLVSHDGEFKLRLRNINPRWLIPSADEFCEIAKTGKIAYILTPIESGSDQILEKMNRKHRAEDFIAAVTKIRRACPEIFIKTQIMVGFPGETEEDFRKSKELFRLGLFNYFEIYAYTPRPGTRAANLPNHVPKKIITQRYKKLLWKSFVGKFSRPALLYS